MKTIELSDDVYALAVDLAQRCEWAVEKVIEQALKDADDLQRDIEMVGERKLRRLMAPQPTS